MKLFSHWFAGNYKDARESDDISDIWANQPKRDPRLIMRSERPCNAETPNDLLGKSYITQRFFRDYFNITNYIFFVYFNPIKIYSNLFYVRHHLPVPEIDMENYKLKISSEDGTGKTLEFTLDDIKKFPKHNVTAALMCAGNRRSQMSNVYIKFNTSRLFYFVHILFFNIFL